MMRVSELTGALLDYWVAKAEDHCWRCEWMLEKNGMREWQSYEQAWGSPTPRYSAEWEYAGPLIDKWGISLNDPAEAHRGEHWEAHITTRDDDCCYSNFGDGDTPLQAICRAVVRAKFGDEVPDIN